MNLFTSNFKTEAKVISIVLLALLICELALRKMEFSLSRDVEHIREIPTIAKNLARARGMRILFLGNSFTRASVLPDIFVAEMKSRGIQNIAVQRVFPDGTRLEEWYYAFKNYFVEPRLAPDLLVVITGRSHLQDQIISPISLGAYFSSRTDVANFLCSANSLDDKVEFLLARYCAVCANRHRIEPRVFNRIIPHYQTCIQRINRDQVNASSLRPRREATYTRLKELLDLGEKNSIPIIIATVPMSHDYSMDPKVSEIIAAHHMTFIEAHDIGKLDQTRFPDGYHIDQSGAEKYTRKIAGEIATVLETDPRFRKFDKLP